MKKTLIEIHDEARKEHVYVEFELCGRKTFTFNAFDNGFLKLI